MYCMKCGKEINEIDKFCAYCGNNTNIESISTETKNTLEDKVIRHQLKPVFKLGYKMFHFEKKDKLIIELILFIAFLITILVPKLIEVFYLVLGIALILSYIMKLVLNYIDYKNTEYNFYDTKVVFKNGFLEKQEKEVKYDDIREVTMSQRVSERIFKIGTIRLYTNASSYNNGIFIHCIENVEENYRIVKKLKDQSTINH